MAFSTVTMFVRTGKIIKEPYTREYTNSAGEKQQRRELMVSVARTRPYTVKVNGKEERPTDWFAARLSGRVAEVFEKYCMDKKEDGSLVSRPLLVQGNFETYYKDMEHIIDGLVLNTKSGEVTLTKDMNIHYMVPNIKNTILVVDEIEFLGSNNNNTQQQHKKLEAQNVGIDIDLSALKQTAATTSTSNEGNGSEPATAPTVSNDFDGTEEPW